MPADPNLARGIPVLWRNLAVLISILHQWARQVQGRKYERSADRGRVWPVDCLVEFRSGRWPSRVDNRGTGRSLTSRINAGVEGLVVIGARSPFSPNSRWRLVGGTRARVNVAGDHPADGEDWAAGVAEPVGHHLTQHPPEAFAETVLHEIGQGGHGPA